MEGLMIVAANRRKVMGNLWLDLMNLDEAVNLYVEYFFDDPEILVVNQEGCDLIKHEAKQHILSLPLQSGEDSNDLRYKGMLIVVNKRKHGLEFEIMAEIDYDGVL